LPEESSPIVVNTGPLIALTHGGVIDLLSRLPYQCISTPQVFDELANDTGPGKVVVPGDFIAIERLEHELDAQLVEKLDPGEASVIQLARERGVKRVCIDELRGRRAAREAGLTVTGSLGLLAQMKQHQLLVKIKPVLDKMLAAGFFVSEELIEQVLRDAGEWTES